MVEKWKVVVIICVIILTLLGWITTILPILPKQTTNMITLSAAILGASFIAYSAITSLMDRVFGIDVLATVAVAVSIGVGEYVAAGVIAIMLGGGEILEDYASNRATKAIEKLIEESPETAIVIRNGTQTQVGIEEVKIGDRVIVKPGGKIPVDGRILKGQATINQASITGESLPTERTTNDNVYAGTIVLLGALEIETTAIGRESTYGKIIQLVEAAEENRAPIERTTDEYAKYFTPFILSLGILVFLITRDPVRVAAVFVIACPCALVLATPTAVTASMANSARKGILIRNGESLEKLSKIDTLVLDKTGTITKGTLQVTRITPFNNHTEAQVLRLAAAAERLSEHPVAQAITQKAREMGIYTEEAQCFVVHPGLGVKADCSQAQVMVGNQKMLQDSSIAFEEEITERNTNLFETGTTVYVTENNKVAGAIQLSDTIREETREVLKNVKLGGITKTTMLTGDNAQTARTIAEQVGIDEIKSDLLPADKAKYIEQLKAGGHQVAMVGDGLNDAPALAASDVGIAMGLRGTDVAIETAGVILASDDLNKIPRLFRISRATIRVIKMNIAIALAVNIIGIALSAYGALPPLVASMVHEGNALTGLFNSLRLLRVD